MDFLFLFIRLFVDLISFRGCKYHFYSNFQIYSSSTNLFPEFWSPTAYAALPLGVWKDACNLPCPQLSADVPRLVLLPCRLFPAQFPNSIFQAVLPQTLGVILDSLSLPPSIDQKILSAQPSKYDRIWTILTTSFASTLAYATLICLDCCISLLIHFPVSDTPYKVILVKEKSDPATPLLKSFQSHLKAQILSVACKTPHTTPPAVTRPHSALGTLTSLLWPKHARRALGASTLTVPHLSVCEAGASPPSGPHSDFPFSGASFSKHPLQPSTPHTHIPYSLSLFLVLFFSKMLITISGLININLSCIFSVFPRSLDCKLHEDRDVSFAAKVSELYLVQYMQMFKKYWSYEWIKE